MVCREIGVIAHRATCHILTYVSEVSVLTSDTIVDAVSFNPQSDV